MVISELFVERLFISSSKLAWFGSESIRQVFQSTGSLTSLLLASMSSQAAMVSRIEKLKSQVLHNSFSQRVFEVPSLICRG
jgi:hypothetical protein